MAKKVNKKIIRRNKNVAKKTKKNEEGKISWKRLFFGVAIFSFSIGVVYVFLCSQLIQVYDINITGVNRIEESEILAVIDDNIQGYFFACVNKGNYFFIKSDKIVEQILQDKRVNVVTVSKKFPNTIFVEITENDIVQAWCRGSEHAECFVVEDGIAISSVSMSDDILNQNNHFVIIDETSSEVQVSDRVMAPEYLDKIELLGEELIYVLNAGIDKFYRVASRGSHEVRFMTDEGWYIVVDVTHDTDEILDVAALFMKKVELPSRRNDLEYIDMRFPEKIFYKMKDGVEQVEEEIDDKKSVDTNAVIDESEDISNKDE